jgi:hypothetical protein
MIPITRKEAVQEFGSGRVEGAEMVILMRNDYPNSGEQVAYLGEKCWRFVPTRDQLNTMTSNR